MTASAISAYGSINPTGSAKGMHLTALLILLVINPSIQQCREKGWLELSNQERWHAANIVILGKDRTDLDACKPGVETCDARNEAREFSHFEVHCILKNNDNDDIPATLILQPVQYGAACHRTEFAAGTTGWLYIVQLEERDGDFFWDEINNQEAITGVYSLKNNDRLAEASQVCNLDLRQVPQDAVEECPSDLGLPKSKEDGCFVGCPRGRRSTKSLDKCYWFSDVTQSLAQNEAAIACSHLDSRLVSLRTERERDELSDVLLTPYKEAGIDVEWWSSGMWRGGTWMWMGEENRARREFTFYEWRPLEPSDDPDTENAIAFVYSLERWGMRDVSNSEKLPFICERVKGQSQTNHELICNIQSEPQCLITTVNNLTSLSHDYWFSNDLLHCEPDSASLECHLPGEWPQTLKDRLFAENGFNPYLLDRGLHLKIQSPNDILEACHQSIQYADQIYTASHPINNEPVPSYYLRSASNLKFVWEPRLDTELCALILVDVGFKRINAMWVNIEDGQLDNADVLVDYRPIKSPSSSFNNVLAILLFEQRESFNTSKFNQDDMQLLFDDTDLEKLPVLDSVMHRFDLIGPVAMTIVPVKFDMFSAKLWKEQNDMDVCQNYFFQAVPDKVKQFINVSPSNVDITTNMDVTLSTAAFQFTLCCQVITHSEMAVTLRPFDGSTESIEYQLLKFQPDILIIPSGRFLGNTTRRMFKDKYYTLILQEHRYTTVSQPEEAETETESVLKHHLLWLVTNIIEGDVLKGNQLFAYSPPSVMDKGEDVLVSFALFEQKELESDMTGKLPKSCKPKSCPFELNDYAESSGLTVSAMNWAWLQWDHYVMLEQVQTGQPLTEVFCQDATEAKLQTENQQVVCTPKKSSLTSNGGTLVLKSVDIYSILLIVVNCVCLYC